MIYSVKFFTKVIESFLSTKYIKVTLQFLKSNSLSIVWELSSFKSCNCSVLNLVEFARPDLYQELEFYSKLKPTLEDPSVNTELGLANIISILSIYLAR